jgi:hypothetical protein
LKYLIRVLGVLMLVAMSTFTVGVRPAAAYVPPPNQCANTLPGGIGYDLAPTTTYVAVCLPNGSGNYVWADFVTSSSYTDVAEQSCTVVVLTTSSVCFGVSTGVVQPSYAPNEVTVHPAWYCVWDPVFSPSSGSRCSRSHVTLSSSGSVYTLDIYLCPVAGYGNGDGCLPDQQFSFDIHAIQCEVKTLLFGSCRRLEP